MSAAGGRSVQRSFTTTIDGDFAIDGGPTTDLDALERRRQRVAPHPWTWLHQVHGADVVVVDRPGAMAGTTADGAVTATQGAVLAVQTADCVPVMLHDPVALVLGAAHGGWRGLDLGVVSATVDAMVRLGAEVRRIVVEVGPHISPAAYEFAPADLTRLALRFGPDVISGTSDGRPALDLSAATRTAVSEAGIDPLGIRFDGRCTATELSETEPTFFSWRARQDRGRQTSAIWMPTDADRLADVS